MSQSLNNSPSLIIQKLRVTKRDGNHLALSIEDTRAGLNVIRGDNSTGRTTLLQLFEFGLGADLKPHDFIPEIKQCERLLLQVELNGTPYTIERKFHGSGYVEVYEGVLDTLVRPPATIFAVGHNFSDFLLHRLNIPRISWIDEYSGRKRAITFNDIYDALYLDQERGFSEIQARLRGKKRENVFKLLMNISVPDLYETMLEETSLKEQRAELEQEHIAVERFLGSVNLPTTVEIEARSANIRKRRLEISTQLKSVREELRARPGYSDPLRQEVLVLENEIVEKQRDLRYSQQTLQAYIELENQLSEDLDKIARIRASTFQLSSFEFEQCPRCLQDITNDMKRRELVNTCSLCNRPLITDSDQSDDLESYEKQIASQVEELAELQQQYKKSAAEITNELQRFETTLVSKRQLLDDAIAQFVSPVIQEVERLGYEIASIDEELARLDDLKNWQARVEQMRNQLSEIDQKIEKIQKRRQELEELEKRTLSMVQPFENFFRQFISEGDVYADFTDVKIDRGNFLPLINDHNYKAKSATQKDIAILGYYYALLRFSLEYDSNIPRFLVVDTLRKDDLDSNTYEKLLKKLKDLEEIYGNAFQLFLVVREPISFLIEDEIEPLLIGRRLLEF